MECEKRVAIGKRPRGVGFLQPKVLLYRETCSDELEITVAFQNVLQTEVDAVIIVRERDFGFLR